jgi:hypothetical protein
MMMPSSSAAAGPAKTLAAAKATPANRKRADFMSVSWTLGVTGSQSLTIHDLISQDYVFSRPEALGHVCVMDDGAQSRSASLGKPENGRPLRDKDMPKTKT